ncbi:hypothetical protein GCM10010517_21020 [Streptosporangium fragile]|uniref:Uncharacterized protein n=1 Tax=Streptosporangium fragile TaxID=46186 RepID=A0ABN3VX07_9ACTN
MDLYQIPEVLHDIDARPAAVLTAVSLLCLRPLTRHPAHTPARDPHPAPAS